MPPTVRRRRGGCQQNRRSGVVQFGLWAQAVALRRPRPRKSKVLPRPLAELERRQQGGSLVRQPGEAGVAEGVATHRSPGNRGERWARDDAAAQVQFVPVRGQCPGCRGTLCGLPGQPGQRGNDDTRPNIGQLDEGGFPRRREPSLAGTSRYVDVVLQFPGSAIPSA